MLKPYRSTHNRATRVRIVTKILANDLELEEVDGLF